MTENTPVTTCPRCHVAVAAQDNYCRQCGRSLKPGYSFIYSHSGIILLALVLGPFALPCVWMSKRISTTAKTVYTVVLGLIGYYFVVACYRIFQLTQDTAQMLMGGGF